MDIFSFLFFNDGYGNYYRNNWYRDAPEKSRESKSREDDAMKKFDAMRNAMETTMIETAINQERAAGSNSHLKDLPTDALNNVWVLLFCK